MKKKKDVSKIYIVRKYIRARSVAEAIRLDKKLPVDDCWVDDEWKKNNAIRLEAAIGFNLDKIDE